MQTTIMSSTQQTFDGVETELHKDKQKCPECQQWYKELGGHWQFSPEHRPSFTQKQREILIGSLLGDGGYNIQKNIFLWQDMIIRPYLEWLQNQFGILSNNIFTKKLGHSVEHLQNMGRSTTIDDVSQAFTLTTKSHPELQFCEYWGYSEDGFESKFPDDVSLTPTILKIWYVSDGGLHYSNGKFQYIRIRNSDQSHRTEYLMSLFNEIGFDVGISSNTIRIPKSQTETFFDYIGEPPTGLDCGFKYKWQYDDYDEYKRLYNTMKAQPYWDRENECLVEDYQ